LAGRNNGGYIKMDNEIIESLAAWINGLLEAAEADEEFSISWFNETEDKPFSIVGGWLDGFSDCYDDILCISKRNPNYAMCIKIVVNEGPYAYTDYEAMSMPYDEKTGEIDDTEIALEWRDNPLETATFFWNEWERIMKEHGEEV
jgi:hypothetical protein